MSYSLLAPCRHGDALQKRLGVLERDPRVAKLMEMADDFQAHKKSVAEQQKAVDAKIGVFHDMVGKAGISLGWTGAYWQATP